MFLNKKSDIETAIIEKYLNKEINLRNHPLTYKRIMYIKYCDINFFNITQCLDFLKHFLKTFLKISLKNGLRSIICNMVHLPLSQLEVV